MIQTRPVASFNTEMSQAKGLAIVKAEDLTQTVMYF